MKACRHAHFRKNLIEAVNAYGQFIERELTRTLYSLLTSAIRQKMFTAHSLLYLVETGTRHSPKSFPQKVFWEREIVLIRTRTPPRAVM